MMIQLTNLYCALSQRRNDVLFKKKKKRKKKGTPKSK